MLERVYIEISILPFSFAEYLKTREIDYSNKYLNFEALFFDFVNETSLPKGVELRDEGYDKIFEYLENEWFVVRHSGEIPEIAFHSSVFFLTEASDGPKLPHSEVDFTFLREAARERFREIILRDILPENRTATFYQLFVFLIKTTLFSGFLPLMSIK